MVISYHRPISMEWEFENKLGGYPFKFNRIWLEDEGFIRLIKDYLKNHQRSVGVSAMEYLSTTLKGLKQVVRQWEKVKKQETNVRIRFIQKEKSRILREVAEGRLSDDLWGYVKGLEEEYRTYQYRREMTWRLKG